MAQARQTRVPLRAGGARWECYGFCQADGLAQINAAESRIICQTIRRRRNLRASSCREASSCRAVHCNLELSGRVRGARFSEAIFAPIISTLPLRRLFPVSLYSKPKIRRNTSCPSCLEGVPGEPATGRQRQQAKNFGYPHVSFGFSYIGYRTVEIRLSCSPVPPRSLPPSCSERLALPG